MLPAASLAPDWNNRAQSVRFFPGFLPGPPWATLCTAPVFAGRHYHIGGVPVYNTDLPFGFADAVQSVSFDLVF